MEIITEKEIKRRLCICRDVSMFSEPEQVFIRGIKYEKWDDKFLAQMACDVLTKKSKIILSDTQLSVIKHLKTGGEIYIWRAPTSGYHVMGISNVKANTIHSLVKKGLIRYDDSKHTHESYYLLTEMGKLYNTK